MRGADLLVLGTRQLRACDIPDPGRDARRLLAHCLGVADGRLTLVLPDEVTDEQVRAYQALIDKRLQRIPVSQLIGSRLFYGRAFCVTSDVLDPRPETEILIECALKLAFETVLDLGTGSGCILLTLLAECPTVQGTGIDLSSAALTIAQQNCAALDLASRARLLEGAWYRPLDTGQTFDLIVSNPPYIAASEMQGLAPEVRDHEPRLALTDEGDGLAAYREITDQVQAYLRPGGHLLVEIGPTQGQAVSEMMRRAGLESVETIQDLDGRDRVICARMPAI